MSIKASYLSERGLHQSSLKPNFHNTSTMTSTNDPPNYLLGSFTYKLHL
eukprot:gene67-3463_t